MAENLSTATLVPELPPQPELARDRTGDDSSPEPPAEVPAPLRKLKKEESAARVLIWRAEVDASTVTCACSLMTRRQPVTAWCPECAAPFEGLAYTRFKDGDEGLTRLPSGRPSIANVWPVHGLRDRDTTHWYRLGPRGTAPLFPTNEFKILGHKLAAKTRLDRLFRSSKQPGPEPYVPPEYGDLPGSVAELEPEYDPPEHPDRLIGPDVPYDSPALEARMRRQPSAKLGVVNTEMYRSLWQRPSSYYQDRPSVSSLLDAWSSSGGDEEGGDRGKPKLTLDATTERLHRAQMLLYRQSGKPATRPPPIIRASPAPSPRNIPKP
ncbi:uncharacterized protein PG986_007882 [Apiospora aurea]|uniref:Uncharacterized protein n=1 Tax=Apiospora aurea TaxID=335848 RepID=A0ABR1QE28_9PEZI